MPEVEFSDRAKEIFLDLNKQEQGVIGAVIDKAVNSPEEVLDSTLGFSEYIVQIEMEPENYVICIDWDENDDILYVLTMGPSSQIND